MIFELEERAKVGAYCAIQEIEQTVGKALATDLLDHSRKTGNPKSAAIARGLAERQCCRHSVSSAYLFWREITFKMKLLQYETKIAVQHKRPHSLEPGARWSSREVESYDSACSGALPSHSQCGAARPFISI